MPQLRSVLFFNNLLTAQNSIPQPILMDNFTIMTNRGGGDCLFHAISQLTEFGAAELRRMVCEFYTHFDFANPNYHEDSLEYKLYMYALTDESYDERTNVPHIENICRPGVYASIMDIIACVILIRRPIVLFHKHDSNTSGRTRGKKVYEYKIDGYSNDQTFGAPPIHILFNGADHYEALSPTSSFIRATSLIHSRSGSIITPSNNAISPGRTSAKRASSPAKRTTTAKKRASSPAKRTTTAKKRANSPYSRSTEIDITIGNPFIGLSVTNLKNSKKGIITDYKQYDANYSLKDLYHGEYEITLKNPKKIATVVFGDSLFSKHPTNMNDISSTDYVIDELPAQTPASHKTMHYRSLWNNIIMNEKGSDGYDKIKREIIELDSERDPTLKQSTRHLHGGAKRRSGTKRRSRTTRRKLKSNKRRPRTLK